jgi:uncharacterized protein
VDMKIAVTGATGFLGRPLVRRLIRDGHSVTALVRQAARTTSVEGAPVQKFEARAPLNPGALVGQEVVIHLAGESIAQRWTSERKELILQSRTAGTSAIVKAAIEAGTVKVLLSASAVGYYGPHGAEELTEESPPGDDFLARVCIAWERATGPASSAGIRTVNLRTGIALHPEGGALRAMVTPFRLGVGGRLGSGKQYLSWIHREDWISLCAYCLTADSVRGPVNFTAPNPVTNLEFTTALGKVLHRPTLLPAPAVGLKVLLGEMATMLLEGQRAVPRRALGTNFRFKFPELPDALGSLLLAASA